jgi:transposase
MSPREAELTQELLDCREELARAYAKIATLEQTVEILIRRIFGKKSEKLDPAQLLLLLQGPATPEETAPAPVVVEEPVQPARRQSAAGERKKVRLPEDLPIIEEVVVPEEVKAAPQDWRRIGEEISLKLEYEAARFFQRKIVRPKYVPRDVVDAVPVVAPLPDCLLERSEVTPSLLTQILVSKYCDHLPLYRQESIYWSRHQVWLPRQTMAEWVDLGAEWLKPIYQEIKKSVFANRYMQGDETPVRYQAPGNGSTKLGYLWAFNVPGGDLFFDWKTSRAAACLEKIIPANYCGTLQCDGYAAYDCFARSRGEGIVLAGCMTHARRKFNDAKEQSPKTAGWILRHFQMLYEVEAQLRENRAGPKLREAFRGSQSRPVLARLHRALERLKTARRFLPSSLMGKAIDYALNQWSSLLVYLDDGRLEIDNNLVENAIRPTAIGKKNWLFFGGAEAGQRSAIIYTIIENCRRRGIDPSEYLRDVLTRLPSATNWQVKDLTPKAWAEARKSADLKKAA